MTTRLPSQAPATFEIRVLPDLARVAQEAAREFAQAASESVRDRGVFRVALAGGSTPRALHERLTASGLRQTIDWTRVRFFWGDERCVGPGNARSNYRMARETLLDPLGIAPENFFRMRGEIDPGKAARLYEALLDREVPCRRGWPRFDLVLLGLGPDGHTASLFPGTRALAERSRRAVANYVPKFREWRLTLTYPVINAARRVIFLAAGQEKREPATRILERKKGFRALPASRVRPLQGCLLWLLDEAAGGDL